MTIPKLVKLPRYFWFKVVDAASPAEGSTGGASGEVGTRDAGRPPRLTEISVQAATAAKCKLVAHGRNPIEKKQTAMDLPTMDPNWFKDALSVHLIEVDSE